MPSLTGLSLLATGSNLHRQAGQNRGRRVEKRATTVGVKARTRGGGREMMTATGVRRRRRRRCRGTTPWSVPIGMTTTSIGRGRPSALVWLRCSPGLNRFGYWNTAKQLCRYYLSAAGILVHKRVRWHRPMAAARRPLPVSGGGPPARHRPLAACWPLAAEQW